MTEPLSERLSPWFSERRVGILLHLTSLPGSSGCGTLGAEAFRFIEFAAACGVSVWQMLPVGPTQQDGSPYGLLSVNAGSEALIDLAQLSEWGWLQPQEVEAEGTESAPRQALLARAAERFFAAAESAADTPLGSRYRRFCSDNADWLDDYALFMALREAHGGAPWREWPAPLRHRNSAALGRARKQHAAAIDAARFGQFVFREQWAELRAHADRRGIALFGDMPIFVTLDSADVWANQAQFNLDAEGEPLTVAGVPPDYFSDTGQRWGNPHYRWDRMASDGFAWWRRRAATQLELFDLVRIDHFRGIEAYWAIPGEAESAIDGRWVHGPGSALLEALCQGRHDAPFVAENLGVITDEVEQLRWDFALPGMLILQFAFDGSPSNPYLPFNHDELETVYTGTHDNDTVVGWFGSLDEAARNRVLDFLGYPGESMPWPLIREVLGSVARLAIIPMQDLLGLDSEHRMNVPGTTEGNWRWRFDWAQVPGELAGQVRHLAGLYGRLC